MQITVKLFATFRIGRFISASQHCRPGTRIADVVSMLGIPQAELGMVMLNNKHAGLEQMLEDGAHVSLFPLLGGG